MTTESRKVKEQNILNISEVVFIEFGYKKTSMRAISDKLNVNNALLHYYFSTKEDLFNKVVIRRLKSFEKIDFTVLTAKNPLEQLLEMIFHNLTLVHNNQKFFKLIISELMRNENGIVVEHIEFFFQYYEYQIMYILKNGMANNFFRKLNTEIIAKNIAAYPLYDLLVKNQSPFHELEKNGDLMEYYRSYFRAFLMEPV